jgi:hypothetical protein
MVEFKVSTKLDPISKDLKKTLYNDEIKDDCSNEEIKERRKTPTYVLLLTLGIFLYVCLFGYGFYRGHDAGKTLSNNKFTRVGLAIAVHSKGWVFPIKQGFWLGYDVRVNSGEVSIADRNKTILDSLQLESERLLYEVEYGE